jgi:hypothetical protein
MQLPALQQELEARFGQLSGQRAENRRIFALEHGLPIDMASLASALSMQLQYGTPNKAFWLAWVVFATEVGYDYAGAEYWQTFSERLPAWRDIDTNRCRSRIRMWFQRFTSAYNGVRPSGTWAQQFRIIAWPITHAILPKDLQYQFARSLHHNRYQIAADSDPLAIGHQIHHRSVHPSSRFREFCEQEELVGCIALALLGADTENLPLSPEATRRIVSDLETTQEAREWLQEARTDIRRIRGVRRQRLEERTPQERAPPPHPRFNLRPSLLLSPESDAWRVGIQIPTFAPLEAASPAVAQYLRKTKVRFEGEAGSWHPAQILTTSAKLHGLQRWPNDGVVLRFKDAFPTFEHLMRQEAALSKGPLWVCRISNDRMAREVRSHHVRPGQKYIVLARAGHAFRPNPIIRPVDLRCEGLIGIQLSLPERVTDDLRHALKTLGLSFTSTVRIWPAGLPAVSWDGEGQSEWLTTDAPCFGIDIDHDVAAVEVALDGVSSLRIPRAGVHGPSWVQLPPLPPGEHRLVVEVKDGAGQAGSSSASRGEVILEVRDPLGLEETIHQRSGLMVIATPIDAVLEDLERGDLQIEVFGPAGREIQWFLKINDYETDRKSVTLPTKLTDLSDQLSDKEKEELGGSSICHLVVCADEIGTFDLKLERENRPLRWLLRRSRHESTIRLVDDAALGTHAQCQMALLGQPCVAKTLDYDACIDGIKVQSPGALFVVIGRDQMDTVIVSQPSQEALHDLTQLVPAPQLDSFASSPDRVPNDIAVLTLWSHARVTGPLGASTQSKVVRTMRNALVRLVCGHAWMDAERKFESSIQDTEAAAVLGDAISTRKEWKNFPAKLRLSHREALDLSPAQIVAWLLKITTAFHLSTDTNLVERALRYLTDPRGFVASSPDVTADVQALVGHGELARGVRYLQILLEDKSWDWS